LTKDDSRPNEPNPVQATDANIKELQELIDREKEEAEKNLLGWKRTQADLENIKKRFEQEKKGIILSGNSYLLKKLLPIIDDMDRAFESMPGDISDTPWVQGMELIHQKLQAMLSAEGIKPIESVGKHFDPKMHDAYCQQNGPEGIVVTEIEKGYTYKGEVLRAAKVTVGNGTEDTELKCNDTID